ncbi:MAG: cystathionine gamma-synthase [Nitriliruptorales bacterium]
MEFETRAIHVGQEPEEVTGSVAVPIFQTSTFVQDAVGEHRGYEYARTGNPTRTALEACLASLESADACVAFASGMAATDAVLRLLNPGDHLILPDDVYGGTFRLVSQVLSRAGLRYSVVDLTDLDALEDTFERTTRLVWAESPTNPLLKVVDIAAVAAIAHERGARLAVDNTFATPYLTRPIEFGAALVVHSTTKYLGGHSDVVGGAVCTDEKTAAELAFLQNAAGAVPGPLDAWLVLRGIKTLGVRMDRHCANAAAVAEYLRDHPKVRRVRYPGLADDPGYEIASRQMRAFGGMVSFHPLGGRDRALEIAAATDMFLLAESLGGVESLVEHPGSMTHASVAGSPLAVPDDLIRLSVGIEHVDDLVADLEQALG